MFSSHGSIHTHVLSNFLDQHKGAGQLYIDAQNFPMKRCVCSGESVKTERNDNYTSRLMPNDL